MFSRRSLFSTTSVALQSQKMLENRYYAEAFEAVQRSREQQKNQAQFLKTDSSDGRSFTSLDQSTYYPGPIRAATPGSTDYGYCGTHRIIKPANERTYWRPVVDDVVIEDYTSLRVQFKDQVWVTSGYEQRLHVIQVAVPKNATVAEVIEQVKAENNSPYLCQAPFHLMAEVPSDIAAGIEEEHYFEEAVHDDALRLVSLPLDATIESLRLHDLSYVSAVVDTLDHVEHQADNKLKDWHEDELSEDELNTDKKQRYRDLGYSSGRSLMPRYQAKPTRNMNFGRMKCQLTTSNVRAMKKSSIGASVFAKNDPKNKGSAGDNEDDDDDDDVRGSSPDKGSPVFSDLQPHAIHNFRHEKNPSLVITVPKNSQHAYNFIEASKCSVMVGHTDPQIFHWFKQLGALPPRSVISGNAEIIPQGSDIHSEVWEKTLCRHPAIHALAEKMWRNDETKTLDEREKMERREVKEDIARMERMSSSDWRGKFQEREGRNPTREEDEDTPLYTLKPEAFTTVKIVPEGKLWTNMAGHMSRVYEPNFTPDPPALARGSFRFIKMLNYNRKQLIPALNASYNMKLRNGFVFEVDEEGVYVMGTEEDLDPASLAGGSCKKEEWSEYRVFFGQNQIIKKEADMEFWIRGLAGIGAPETTSQDQSSTDLANMAETDFRQT